METPHQALVNFFAHTFALTMLIRFVGIVIDAQALNGQSVYAFRFFVLANILMLGWPWIGRAETVFDFMPDTKLYVLCITHMWFPYIVFGSSICSLIYVMRKGGRR